MRLEALHGGVLLRRSKRFLAEVRLDDGREVVAHCPNPGSMRTCAEPGWRALLSFDPSPRRRLSWTLEMMLDAAGRRILVNTARPNALALESVDRWAPGARVLRREAPHGEGRVDLLLADSAGVERLVEVKSVTMLATDGVAEFPDSVTSRGTRQLGELAESARAGRAAMVLFLIGREGVRAMRPADAIDPAYGLALRAAKEAGVELRAWSLRFGEGVLEVGDPAEVLIAPAPPAPSSRPRGSGRGARRS